MTSAIENECAHIPCRCPAEAGTEYCCPQCEQSLGKTDCECGHPECGALAIAGGVSNAENTI